MLSVKYRPNRLDAMGEVYRNRRPQEFRLSALCVSVGQREAGHVDGLSARRRVVDRHVSAAARRRHGALQVAGRPRAIDNPPAVPPASPVEGGVGWMRLRPSPTRGRTPRAWCHSPPWRRTPASSRCRSVAWHLCRWRSQSRQAAHFLPRQTIGCSYVDVLPKGFTGSPGRRCCRRPRLRLRRLSAQRDLSYPRLA